jgi:ribose 5-phosphate isomerase B
MRVHLGSDHAGLELKEHLLDWLAKKGHEAVDHGPFVIGGSGNGEQIAANKVKGIRAALVWSEETAVLARDHNDANVISVGGRMHTLEELTRFIDVFLHTPYSNGDRHDRRLGQIAFYEKTGNLPPLPESALGHQS